ncbi:methylated-DNA--[protein]-cysteine S-methyltransferase [Paracoccus sp. DMF-8]|uniref:methylated-DNA--[protein]-cysteine S-methyltransferase n=1 Tax=Paracoccus sp. DMF-8 TaxID=3019445 RepID=UPI0023E8F8BD|nr:methylated-DNA--[protein]-cysteine S-methyltransferase [Paracoccus sp. DMF-8]MDF3605673.1 methylated-DNA--[protein]-cysteine S-methyltransferase [Paracoccus sp. DMF-8]
MMRPPLHIPPPDEGLSVTVTHMPDSGRGAVLCIGSFATPLGPVIAIGAEGTLWALGLAAEIPAEDVRADLTARFPGARFVDAPEALAPAIATLIAGKGEIRVRLAGTGFQTRVWQALLEVPPGKVVSYATLAGMIGQPRAVRAVGTAVGANPVSWVVPCHRVTRTGGAIGGYHWGETVKRALLSREGAAIAPLLIAEF